MNNTSQRAERRIRQKFSVFVGWFGVALGVVIAGGGARSSSMVTVAVGVALGILAYLVLARPFVASASDELVVSNVIREVTLPWDGISHAKSRGSLVIYDNDGGKTTAWAIGSQKATRRNQTDDSGRRTLRPQSSSDLKELPSSSRSLCEAINAETVDNPVDTPSGRQVRWLALPCVLMAVAVIAIVAAFVS